MTENGHDECGYSVLRAAIGQPLTDGLLDSVVGLINEHAQAVAPGVQFTAAHDPALVDFFNRHREVESRVYDEVRQRRWLTEICSDPSIAGPIADLLGEQCALLSKIVFRIDMPMWTHELALWHQDYQYVRGNTRILTAWIPLQDTRFEQGCLSVMPGSHKLGPVPHDAEIGKRQVPSGIFDRPIQMVELDRGDLLLFDALLLHSSNVNFSESIRYSIQARYTPLGEEIDPSMGTAIPLTEAVAG